MKTFYAVLANSLAASLTNNFVWFAVTFWVYLQTRSVLATSVMAGVYSGTVAATGFFLGSLVDRYPKKLSLLVSSLASQLLYGAAALLYFATPARVFTDPSAPVLWVFVVLTLFGAIAGNLRSIALSTLVTLLVPEPDRERANGMVGTSNGVSFLVCSIFSGLVIGYLGMGWMLGIAFVLTILVVAHLLTLHVPDVAAAGAGQGDGEPAAPAEPPRLDIAGTIRAVRAVPGLFGLIFFSTFNNLLGGVYMSLMDAYGLSMVSVQVWGFLWGALSLGFIVGGLVVAKKGLGGRPLRALFLSNIVLWAISSVFAVRSSIVLLAIGMFVYLCLIPAVEAAEQTVFQKVIPPERQGRVFGFAQSAEQAASPVTSFVIGPVAQFVFIPFMSVGGAGARLLGPWFGVGPDRGLGLLFTVTGLIGLAVTLFAMRSAAYRRLSVAYQDAPAPEGGEAPSGTSKASPGELSPAA